MTGQIIIFLLFLIIGTDSGIFKSVSAQTCSQRGGYCTTSSPCPAGYQTQQGGNNELCPNLQANNICCVPRSNATPTPDTSCRSTGQSCGAGIGNCCSNLTCNLSTNRCEGSGSGGGGESCRNVGQSCNTPSGAGAAPCCSGQQLSCVSNQCCRSSGGSCTSNTQCCGTMTCQNGTCRTGSGGGAVCGNGACETGAGETPTSCPTDCGGGGGGGGTLPTRTPTSAPGSVNRCNATCSFDSQCANAADGCSRCLPPPGGGLMRCRVPNTPTPTRRVNTPTTAPSTHTLNAGVFVDRDGDGEWQTQDDISILGILIVDFNGNGQFDSAEDPGPRTRVYLERRSGSNWTAVTNGYTATSGINNGRRIFSNLTTGRYRIRYAEIPTTYTSDTYSPEISVTGNRTYNHPLILNAPGNTDITNTVTGTIGDSPTGECNLTGLVGVPGAVASVFRNTDNWPSNPTGANGRYSISVTGPAGNEYHLTLSNIGSRVVQCAIITQNGVQTQVDLSNPTYGPFDISNPPDDITIILKTTQPWFQTEIGSVRQQTIQNRVPAGERPTTSINSGTASVFYSTTGSSLFGSASDIWRVDNEYDQVGASNREGNASYSFYKKRQEQSAAVNLTPLPGCSPSGNCTFIASLSSLNNQTFYYVDGDLTFNPSGPANRSINNDHKIIILAKGNITINSDVRVATGKSLLIFAAKGDVTIGTNVGEVNPSSTNPNLQAIITAENDILIPSIANCPATADRRLNIEGTLVANADNPFGVESAGGRLINDRTLCTADATNPSLFVKSRLSFITALTDFYKVSNSMWNEVAP